MEIYELKLLLEDMEAVGIDSAIIEPTEDGKTLVRASNEKKNVIVFGEVAFDLTDKPLAISNVSSLLSRVNLFDVNASTVEVVDADGCVGTLVFKQGRRKTKYRCSNPTSLSVPKKLPEGVEMDEKSMIILSDKYVSYMASVINSMSNTVSKSTTTVSIEVVDNNATISVSDGESDSFSDVLEGVTVASVKKSSWDAKPFANVMKKALRGDVDSAKLMITEKFNFAVFTVGCINVIVPSSV